MYGLALTGPLVSAAGPLFGGVRPDWPPVELAWAPAGDEPVTFLLEGDRARVPMLTGGWVEVDRPAGRATFRRGRRPDAHHLAHPGAAPVGALFARWLGRHAFHGGAVVLGGVAWVLLAAKDGGKSTTLAWLAAQGHEVVADDIVVVDDDGLAYAGPRCIDLRPAAAQYLSGRFGAALPLVLVRDGARHRLVLPPITPTVPLGGWVLLADEARVGVTRLPPADRIAPVAASQALRTPSLRPAALLELVRRPVLELRRPRTWEGLKAAGDLLLTLTGEAAGSR